jgi:flagellar biosynthesis protein FlhF
MNIQRFTAPTAREALSKARHAFGDGTLILSNRQTATGVEVVATGEDTLAELDRNAPERPSQRLSQRPMASKTAAGPVANPESAVLDDTTQLAMSTLSFQDYVRERMLRRRHEAMAGQATPSAPERTQAQVTPFTTPQPARAAMPATRPTPVQIELPTSQNKPIETRGSASAAVATPSQSIVDELHAMKALIEDRFNTLTWLGQARQNPIHSNLMLKLIRAGYSPALCRTIVEKMAEDITATDAMRWVMDVLTRNVRTDATARPIHEEGGTFALVGATGVGKTTTAAKLAGLCARTHGPASVGLITLDTYRVGAHEQLRAYGRMLGVVAHLAHDRAALQDLLGLLANKKMVLIDTTGIAPGDPRKREMLEMLDLPGINRLLVLNAGGHGDTLDDMVGAFKTGLAQQTILSKTDEAAKIGPALDAAIRHQLVLRGVTTGQKVPEDWERADAASLVAMSMRSPARSAFDPAATDLGFFFAQSSGMKAGQLHA